MKSKYYQALFFVGVLPVLFLTGGFLWILFNQAPSPKSPSVNTAASMALLPSLKTQVDTMANSMASAIDKTNAEIPNLYAHNSDGELDTFIKTHQGISGIVVLSQSGKVLRTVPASPPLITDPSYGTSEEFQKTAEKLKDNGGKPYLFYTLKLGYPAFVFAVPTNARAIAEAIISLADFFRHIDTNSGDISLLEAGSGNFFYHTNPAKIGTSFNPNQEPWLTEIQNDLVNKRSGSKFNPDRISAVYAPVFAKFGIVHTFPSSILQPPAPASAVKSQTFSLENLPEFFQTPTGMAIMVAFFATLGWVLIIGSLFFGLILGPVRKASAAILNAANGKSPLTAETARRFGKNEVGQMVQAASALMEKLEKEKQEAGQEKEEALRRGAAQVDAKTKEAANQVATAQQQAQATRTELNEKNQLLNDKLKELDALKSMSEGLRNQTEQARAEIGKLKSQITTTEQSKSEAELRLKETQLKLESQLKEMESKLLEAVGASSAIKVSQVRAAAIRTMSEELKTTLGIIKGYVSSALGASQGGINEKQQEFLGMVINRSARLEKFINDLVDIYQVEIEQADSKPEEVNLASEIEGLAFNFQAQAEVKNIKMKVEAKGAIPKVPIVRRRFNQLWNILYLQIIKDAPRGSSITILVEPLGGLVKVTVHDPGLTVAPDSLPKLFDEFYDPKHPASPQLAGTGLKFALVKTILASHGGGAVAEKADPGTKLILTFPTQFKKPGEAPIPIVGASPSVMAPGIKAPPLAPPSAGLGIPKPPPPSIGAPGLPRPAVPGMGAPGLPRPAIPPSSGVPGMPAPPAMGSPGSPKPAVPGGPAAPAGAPGLPKPAAPAGAGVFDSLLSKVPPPTAPGLKPPTPPAPSAAPAPGSPASPRPAMPGMPAPPPMSAPKAPAPGGGLLDALLDKKPAAPAGVPPAGVPAPRPVTPPPAGMGAPGAPAVPRPPVPGVPPVGSTGSPQAGAPPMAPRPAVPGAPAMGGSPAAAPRPVMPPTPGTPSAAPAMPAAPRPPMPSAPAAAPGMPPAGAPKVVPTGLKSAPAPGVLDLDSADGMKTEVKPPVPRPPMPGAPPPGAPKPPAPGVPPGGLNATPPPKKDEGELIE